MILSRATLTFPLPFSPLLMQLGVKRLMFLVADRYSLGTCTNWIQIRRNTEILGGVLPLNHVTIFIWAFIVLLLVPQDSSLIYASLTWLSYVFLKLYLPLANSMKSEGNRLFFCVQQFVKFLLSAQYHCLNFYNLIALWVLSGDCTDHYYNFKISLRPLWPLRMSLRTLPQNLNHWNH